MFGITFRKETEEKRWLRKALDGDNTATEWIYRKHVRYLSALCSRYITEDEDIKDVLQESFIKIFTSLDSFKYRGEGSLKAWIAKITLNETLKFVRNNSRLPIDSIDDKDTNIADGDSMETVWRLRTYLPMYFISLYVSCPMDTELYSISMSLTIRVTRK